MKYKKLIIPLAVVIIVSLASIIFSACYTITIRWPQQTKTGTNPGRLCIYSHSNENYTTHYPTGKGVYDGSSLDPHWCSTDNGTYICLGPIGSQQTYDNNGTLIENITYSFENATWILKNQSGLCIFDWQFG